MSKYVTDNEKFRTAGGATSAPTDQAVEVSGFRFSCGPISSSARERPVGDGDFGSITSSIAASPIMSGLDQKKGGARNDVPQLPRSPRARNGCQVKPTLGLKVLPASL